MLLILIALVIGIGIPIQTAVNSKLRSYVLSPYIASFISFLVGTIFLALMTLATRHTLLVHPSIFTDHPWWIWIGGILGVIGLTTNILLFPKLGGVQTVVLPIMGQIIMSMLIDNFGWFNSPVQHFTLLRALGVLVLIIGVVCVIVLADYFRKKKNGLQSEESINKLPFQAFGIFAGMLMASQSAINGHLGGLLHSAIHAAFVSFLVGLTLLFIVAALIIRKIGNVTLAIGKDRPWWIWIGGMLGAFYILGVAYLIPHLGTGLVVVITLLGQILCSILVDKFGILGAKKQDITGIQLAGLVLMIIGVAMIKIF